MRITPRFSQAGIQLRQFLRTTSHSVLISVVIFFIVTIVAELAAIFLGALAGVIVDGILIIGLVNLTYFMTVPETRRIFMALILVPFLRILSIAIPIPQVSPIFWYVMIGIPLLLAAMIGVWVNKLPALTQSQPVGKLIVQVLFGLSGIPLALLAARVLPAVKMPIPDKSLGWVILGAIILFLFSALIDEIIFRGLVQNAFSVLFGRAGIIVTSILYAAMFLGTLQPGYVIFFGLTGLLFSAWVKFSDSLWGAIIAHGLFNLIFLLILAH